jgi:uncharacterized protein (TIGR02231 family)
MPAIETSISEVTVYVDRARVIRKGTIHLAPGEQTITIERLPTSLMDDSVRAAGRGAGVRILGVEVARDYYTDTPEEDQAALQKELQTLQDRDAALADADSAEASRLEFLKNLANNSTSILPRGIAYGKADLNSVVSFSKYISDEIAAAQTRRRELAQQRRDLAREIEVVQSKLQPRYDSIERIRINVVVEATADTDLELEVTYSVNGASWSPLYDVRLVEEKVSVGYLANVQQTTGEDWPEVLLSLSTARPAISTTIPELDPWFLDVYRPPMPKMARMAMAPTGGAADMAMMPETAPMAAQTRSMEAYEPPPPAEIATATVEASGTAVTFRVARPVGIPSDGSPHKTVITNLDLGAKLDYVTVPKIAEEAYLRATISNTSPSILLPGPANIFHADEFVGTTQLELVAPNEEFDVQLGVDDRLKVERKLTERSTGKTFIGNTRKSLFGYTISITNNLPRPARVTVEDQFPVSRHEQIKTTLQSIAPQPTEQTDMNLLKWELEIPPGKKQEIGFTFQVEQPRDMQISGIAT